MAGFRDIDISKRKETTRLDATKLFTDREEPQEAFVRKLRSFAPWRKNAYTVL